MKNITGKKFGRLTVIEYSRTFNKRAYWKCFCDCGNFTEKMGKCIRNGSSLSCGCLQKDKVKETLFKDITGQKFNFLTVIKCLGQLNSRKEYWWECKCDCGKIISTTCNKLTTGHNKSCGCLHNNLASKNAIKRNKTMVGKNHPCWRHDLSDSDRKKLEEERKCNPKLNRWRKKVYERDKYTCFKCGDAKGGNLVAHHIYSWSTHENLRYVTNNGVTLCKCCHACFHKKYGFGKNTKKQWNEFLNYGNV